MRITGRYSLKSSPVSQLDYQIEPAHWRTVEGFKLPVRGPFTQAVANRGTACLYVSQPGEVPLYYSLTPGWIHWHEQKLALPGKPAQLPQGCALIWTPQGAYYQSVDELPHPSIASEEIPQMQAIAQYWNKILDSVQRRLNGRKRVAVAQSGGPDSLLITRALTELGIDVVPLTVCTRADDPDITAALGATTAMGCPTIPVVIEPSQVDSLMDEAVMCLEHIESSNVRMAIGNLLMARKCKELGIDLIFLGHGHDDVHGKGTLVKGVFAEQKGTPSERWRDARRLGTEATSGMLKMFASTFRRYGIQARMPYYDADLLEWAFSQPTEVIPIDYKKSFVHAVADIVMPYGFWLEHSYSMGYLTGAGLSLKQGYFKSHKELFSAKSLYGRLKKFSSLPLSDRISKLEAHFL